jgi:hypothetical protein
MINPKKIGPGYEVYPDNDSKKNISILFKYEKN